ncbi:hypothetical protein GGI13_002457 [Coemansia sp. RSA 455]|nr:hypothetical protein IW146_005139 [Coemansia sp. RSA 922]KAJ2253885.1 hypothetical protein GGI13_002457 [Coemansia sp. RSA 455]
MFCYNAVDLDRYRPSALIRHLVSWYQTEHLQRYISPAALNKVAQDYGDSIHGLATVKLSSTWCKTVLAEHGIVFDSWGFRPAAWLELGTQIDEVCRKGQVTTWIDHIQQLKRVYIGRRCPGSYSWSFWYLELCAFYNMYSEYMPKGFDCGVRVAADISADLQAYATRKRKVAANLKQQRYRAAKADMKKEKVDAFKRRYRCEQGRIITPKHVEQNTTRLPRLASLHLQCSAVCSNPCPHKDHGYFPPAEAPLVSAVALSIKRKREDREESKQIVGKRESKRIAALKRHRKPIDEIKRGNERVATH